MAGGHDEEAIAPIDWPHAARTAAAWLAVGCVGAGIVMPLHMHSTLDVYGAGLLVAPVVMTSLTRALAARIGATAAWMAAAFATDDVPYVAFALALPLAGIAFVLASLIAMTTCVVALGIPPGVFWDKVAQFAVPGDLAAGAGTACAYTVVLGAASRPTLRLMRRKLPGRLARAVVAWLVAQLLFVPVDVAVGVLLAPAYSHFGLSGSLVP